MQAHTYPYMASAHRAPPPPPSRARPSSSALITIIVCALVGLMLLWALVRFGLLGRRALWAPAPALEGGGVPAVPATGVELPAAATATQVPIASVRNQWPAPVPANMPLPAPVLVTTPAPLNVDAASIADQLTVLYASLEALCIKTRGFTFNILSKDFYEFHSFFNLQIKWLQDAEYEVAERIRSLGVLADALTPGAIRARSIVPDAPGVVTQPSVMVATLLQDYTALADLGRRIFHMAGTVSDAGTIALITAVTKQLEHYQWELRSMTERWGF